MSKRKAEVSESTDGEDKNENNEIEEIEEVTDKQVKTSTSTSTPTLPFIAPSQTNKNQDEMSNSSDTSSPSSTPAPSASAPLASSPSAPLVSVPPASANNNNSSLTSNPPSEASIPLRTESQSTNQSTSNSSNSSNINNNNSSTSNNKSNSSSQVNSSAQKTSLLRLKSDLNALDNDTPEGVSACPIDVNNLYLWRACIFGPPDTPWEGGVFPCQLIFPLDYPVKAPSVRFTCKLYHPNVFADGTLCLDIIQDQWSPVFTVSTILTSIQSLLTDPNPNSPANPEAAKLYSSDKKAYNKNVRACVAKCSGM